MHLGDDVKVADREIALSDRHDEPKREREKEQLVERRQIQSTSHAFIVSFSLPSPLALLRLRFIAMSACVLL